MNQSSLQLLNKLLNAWQSDPDHTRKVRLPISETRAPQYFDATLPDAKEALHAGLLEAESSGAVTLEWGRGYEKHILKRITLEDGSVLAHYLGISLATKQAEDARMILERELSGRETWINEWVQEVLKMWSRNQSAGGLSSGDIVQARLLVRALEAVAAGRHRNLDLRTFSIRELGSSKAMEAILTRFASIWKMYHPADLTKDELMEILGLVKFPHPLLIRGPVTLKLTDRLIDCAGIQPFVGLPPQAVREVCSEKMPEFVLTIENLASFNRYTAEIQDNGLILYTAGFPAPGIADFLRLLDASLPSDIPFFHWGDIDEGGLKIFIYIQGLLTRTLKPHLMTPDLLALYGQPNHNLRIEEVRRTADKNLEVMPIAEAMLSTNPPKTLEQENIDPFGVSA
jgi:hypothetical protein